MAEIIPRALPALCLTLVISACSAPSPAARTAFAPDAQPAVPMPAPEAVARPARYEPARPAPFPSKQDEPSAFALGLELRGYPAGLIVALYGEHGLSEHGVLTFDLGGNFTDRSDFGEHDQEDGSGFGGGLGYRYYFGEQRDRWFAGGRVDLWSLTIDWEDAPGSAAQQSGSSDVLVLQPTLEGGYGFRLGERWRLNLFAAVGAEINVKTDGEDVGQGAIGILGVSILYDF